MSESKPCVFGVYCSKHGFIHGAEAEELRERIEQLVSEYREAKRDAEADCPHDIAPVGIIHGNAIRALSEILDTVDARDSVAWLEFRDAEPIEPHAVPLDDPNVPESLVHLAKLGVLPAARPTQAHRDKHWPCGMCGRAHEEFSVPSNIWNAVMREDGIERPEYICIDCFDELALSKGVTKWQAHFYWVGDAGTSTMRESIEEAERLLNEAPARPHPADPQGISAAVVAEEFRNDEREALATAQQIEKRLLLGVDFGHDRMLAAHYRKNAKHYGDRAAAIEAAVVRPHPDLLLQFQSIAIRVTANDAEHDAYVVPMSDVKRILAAAQASRPLEPIHELYEIAKQDRERLAARLAQTALQLQDAERKLSALRSALTGLEQQLQKQVSPEPFSDAQILSKSPLTIRRDSYREGYAHACSGITNRLAQLLADTEPPTP